MKYILVILLMFSLLSCEESQPGIEYIDNENLTSEQIDSILTDFKFQYESPIVLDCTNQVLIPISTKLLERKRSFSKDGYYSEDYPRYWNILFYNRATGETRLLTDEKIRISQIHATPDSYEESGKFMVKKVLYEIGDIDHNSDKKLDGKDPQFLFVSEINGESLTRVSPHNEDLQYFEVVPSSRQILLRTLRDVNQDSLFNSEDESIWYKAELVNNHWTIKEIIDSSNRRKIEKIYFDQWLKKK